MEMINRRNTVIRIKNVSDGPRSRLETLESRVSEPEDGNRMHSV